MQVSGWHHLKYLIRGLLSFDQGIETNLSLDRASPHILLHINFFLKICL